MGLVEREYVPDFIIRRGIRFLLSKRLQEVQTSSCDTSAWHDLAGLSRLGSYRYTLSLPWHSCLIERLRRRIVPHERFQAVKQAFVVQDLPIAVHTD
jgi:hypothetical protein